MARTEKGFRYAAGMSRAFGVEVPITSSMVAHWEKAREEFESQRNEVLRRAVERRRSRIERYKELIAKQERAIGRIKSMMR